MCPAVGSRGRAGGACHREGLSRSPDATGETRGQEEAPLRPGLMPVPGAVLVPRRRPHVTMVIPSCWKTLVFVLFSTFWPGAT